MWADDIPKMKDSGMPLGYAFYSCICRKLTRLGIWLKGRVGYHIKCGPVDNKQNPTL